MSGMKAFSLFLVLILLSTSLSGSTADIHRAASAGDLEAVRDILAEDPGLIEALGERNATPLFSAADAGNRDIVLFLLENGADIDHLDSSMRGVIFHPSYTGDDAMVELLLDHGADPLVKDGRGNTPIFWAAVRGHKSTVALFAKKGFPVTIHEAAACGHIGLIEKALENGQRPDDLNSKGNTPVHSAVNSGQLESVKYLIEAGADLTIKDENGQTPFDLAIERDAKEVLAFLGSKGYKETPVIDPDIVLLADNIRRITFPYHMHTNIVVHTGPDGILMVDTGFSKRAAARLKNEIASTRDGDITYLINSHEHWDHVAGNFIAGEATRIISFSVIDEAVSGGSLSRMDEEIGGRTEKGFEYFYSMRFNDEEIRLIPFPGIHSGNDILTHFTGSNVVHMGDLLLSQSFPAIGDVPRYLEFLDIVIDVFPDETIFVSGHGTDLTREGVIEYRRMLQTTVDMVRTEMSKGRSLDEVNEAGILKEYESYGELLTFLGPDSWARRIYNSYGG